MNQNLNSKKVIVRVDYNVPINSEGIITDDTRIVKSLPTIDNLIAQGAKIVLMSHLGRPLKELKEDGTINKIKFSLEVVAKRLRELVQTKVYFASDCGGPESEKLISQLQNGEIVLLENTRFVKGEEKGDVAWAESLSKLGEFYINDAFGAAHREHATTATIARFFDKDHKGFGLLMDAELKNSDRILNNPERPLTAITGGAKVSDKIALLENLIDKCDNIIIGGGMAYTFFAAQGIGIGKSLCESDKLELANSILQKAKEKSVQIYLPIDSVSADKFDNGANIIVTTSKDVDDNMMGLDIGPKTIELFKKVILESKTIVWNGPMGVFEMSNFSNGTQQIALTIADATKNHGAFSLIGGGDSVAAINKFDLSDSVSFVSTGGGAMLELLEGKELPGVVAINN
ncbi:MAG: phosphoglycerate kinase [Saprospiraceae bacterium]|nr:phosphoglycerate kinase [Saprospiraceae bacterium]